MKCRSGGIGRRAGFRCLWSQDRVGSSPISCILFYFKCISKPRKALILRGFCFFCFSSYIRLWQNSAPFLPLTFFLAKKASLYIIKIFFSGRWVPAGVSSYITVSSDISLQQIHSTCRQSGYSSILTCLLP